MKKTVSFILAAFALGAAFPLFADELLINGDFEMGAPMRDKSPSFTCEGWRRLLWKPTEWNAWLTSGARKPVIGDNNQAIEIRWDASSICQYFSASAGQPYSCSVDTFYPGNSDSRWQPRIQVQWFGEKDQPIGEIVTVAEANSEIVQPKQWNRLTGSVTALTGTAYGRILLNVGNKKTGQMWVSTFFDNASVQGQRGTHNLPASFVSSPYPMTLAAIHESSPFQDSLARYSEDKDGDALTFTLVRGPAWLKMAPDGSLSGTPEFKDAGGNILVVKVSDGKGSSDTQTLTIPVIGQLRLANAFDDDMVLQRESPVPVWGYAVPSSPVQVQMSTGEKAETSSDADGNWSVTLPALKPTLDGPLTMTVNSGTRTLELKNILVGDVWLCSGQSNMSWKLEGTDDSVAAIAAANCPMLRILSHPDESSPTPRSELMARAEWEVCTPETVKPFSAVAFYFGRKLSAVTGIPIGLISSNQGGTKIEPWTGGPLYNARIHPYTRLPIKGVIWYQGEANLADGAAYTDKLVKMVRDWRAAWGLGDFPFFYVQVAPFKYENQNPLQLPELWEGQTKATQLIPNSGMVVINDVGNVENIHPLNKATVGERLARWALNKTYGHAEILTSGPMVRAVSVEGQRLRVSFYYTDRGLASRDGKPLSWFEVAGVDETYVKAEAVLDGDSVLVSAPTVPSPTWVRFAWQNIAEPNLMNKEGLPANSFRMKVSKLEN